MKVQPPFCSVDHIEYHSTDKEENVLKDMIINPVLFLATLHSCSGLLFKTVDKLAARQFGSVHSDSVSDLLHLSDKLSILIHKLECGPGFNSQCRSLDSVAPAVIPVLTPNVATVSKRCDTCYSNDLFSSQSFQFPPKRRSFKSHSNVSRPGAFGNGIIQNKFSEIDHNILCKDSNIKDFLTTVPDDSSPWLIADDLTSVDDNGNDISLNKFASPPGWVIECRLMTAGNVVGQEYDEGNGTFSSCANDAMFSLQVKTGVGESDYISDNAPGPPLSPCPTNQLELFPPPLDDSIEKADVSVVSADAVASLSSTLYAETSWPLEVESANKDSGPFVTDLNFARSVLVQIGEGSNSFYYFLPSGLVFEHMPFPGYDFRAEDFDMIVDIPEFSELNSDLEMGSEYLFREQHLHNISVSGKDPNMIDNKQTLEKLVKMIGWDYFH